MKNEITEKGFDENVAKKELAKGYAQAETILKSQDNVEEFLQRLEKKIKEIPLVGNKLLMLPIMISLVRSYAIKQYTNIPIGSIIAITSALLYILSPIDLIPDIIPGVGYVDDVAVIMACWKLVEIDVEMYAKWREENDRTHDLQYPGVSTTKKT